MLRQVQCDFLSISGHKIYGPAGVGALYVRRCGSRRIPLKPLMCGGGQEMGLRPGTLPVPLIVGLGRAAELAGQEYQQRNHHAARLKRKFLERIEGGRSSDQWRLDEDAVPRRQRQLSRGGQRSAHAGFAIAKSRSPTGRPARRPATPRAMC